MRKDRLMVGAVMAFVVGMAAAVWADDFRASISGSSTSSSFAVTNTTGARMSVHVIALTKVGTDWNTATNTRITLNNGAGTFLLLSESATNTVVYSSASGRPWERSGIISFAVGGSTATTNQYLIGVK